MSLVERDSLITKALKHYHTHLSEAYAAAVACSDKIPEQINNEIRNAVTHLSRAAVADTAHLVDQELDSATRHIERAIRDCYKIAVLEVNLSIQSALRVIQHKHGGVTKSTASRYWEATKERKRIICLEHKAVAGSSYYATIARSYRDLFRVLAQIYETILEEYQLTEKQIEYFPYLHRFWKVMRPILGLLVAYLLGVFTNYSTDGFVSAFLTRVWEPIAGLF